MLEIFGYDLLGTDGTEGIRYVWKARHLLIDQREKRKIYVGIQLR